MGDMANGKALFQKLCAVCHTANQGGKHRVGPNLFGVMGRTCGTSPGFNYSDSMKSKSITWNESTMNEYLELPRKFIPGTRMVFNGIKKAEERRDLIAYLSSLK